MILSFKFYRSKALALSLLCFSVVIALGIIYVRGRILEASSQTAERFTLVIDPGHGGIDGGAVAVDGSRESDVNLAIALKLRALAEFYGQDNTLTRQEDISLSPGSSYSEHDDLVCRAQIVNSAINPVLMSVHQNCYPTGQPSGAQVLFSASPDSEDFGKLTHYNLISALDPANRRVAEPASKKLYVLSHVSCPAILIECGFMSNYSDIIKLNDSAYQTSVSAVLMASFIQFTNKLNLTQT